MSKVALITGASGGIGQAIALRLASKGYTLLLHYHANHEQALWLQNNIADTYQVPVFLCQANLGVPQGVDQFLQQVKLWPDILIHNAGVSQYGLFTDITQAEYQHMLQLHLTSPFRLTQHFLPAMIQKKWGRIIFITSIWGETGAACETLYSMVKGGLIALAKSLAKELAPSGITVNAVSPGFIQTKMNASFSEEETEAILEQIPLGRMGLPEEIAHAVQFLVDQESAYITGQILRVNGGWYT